MKKKSMLALLLATAMIAGSSMTALAAQGNLSGNNGSVSGDGDVTYVDKTIYQVGVPTSNSIKLIVDPQGLADLGEGETIKDDVADSKAGRISCVTKMPLLNLSSVDVVVDVDLKLTGDATEVTTNKDDVNTGTDTNVLLYAAPTSKNITKKANVDTDYASPKKGIVMPKAGAKVSFVLPAATDYATHNVSGDFKYLKADPDLGNGTAIAFSGWVNKNADWKDYTGDSASKKVGLDVVYEFDENTANKTPADPADSIYMVSYNGATVDVPAGSDTPTPGALSFTKQGDGTYTCTVAGAAQGKSITKLLINGTDRTAAISLGKLTYNDSSRLLTITAGWNILAELPATCNVVATINNIDYTISLTK